MRTLVAAVAIMGLLSACRLSGDKPDGSGTIECTQVQVAPEVAGIILQLPPQEGDTIKKGSLIAQLDPRNYELKRDEAKAVLQAAETDLKRIEQVYLKKTATQKQMDDAQSAYDLAEASVKLVHEMLKGAKPSVVMIDCPLITKDNVDKYIEMHKRAGAL